MGGFAASRPLTIVLPFVFRPKHFINQPSANSSLINIACIITITYNRCAFQQIGSGTHKKAKYAFMQRSIWRRLANPFTFCKKYRVGVDSRSSVGKLLIIDMFRSLGCRC